MARKLEIMKLSHMTDCNAGYTLTKGTAFSLDPAARKRNKQKGTDTTEDDKTMTRSEDDFVEDEHDIRNFDQVRTTENVQSLFTEKQLSGLTLEQKMLSGMFKPKINIKKRNDAIEFI